MASLPEDMMMVIFSKLPVKSISRFRSVCKHWYELLNNPKFIKMHLHHVVEDNKFSVLLRSFTDEGGVYYHTIDFDVSSSSYHMAVQINLPSNTYTELLQRINSCHGLIGLCYNRDDICLWNPLTREYKKTSIPRSISIDRYDECALSECGFCYDWKNDEYKLFVIVDNDPYDDDHDSCGVWVSRLGSNSWKNIGNIRYDRWGTVPTPLNGIIRWIGESKVIFSFDIVEEAHTKEIQIPSCYLDGKGKSYSYEDMEVGVLGEDLYLSVNATSRKRNFYLWVMKDCGVVDSWTKIFSLSKDETSFDAFRPLHYLDKNGKILLFGIRYETLEDEDLGKNDLVSYDPKTGRLATLDIPCMPRFSNATTFVGSLVSLNSGKFVKVERAKSWYLVLGRYFVFLLVLLGIYLAF